MPYVAERRPASRDWRTSASGDAGFTRLFIPAAGSTRLAAAIAGPRPTDWAAESDRAYYRRRSREERSAADRAVGVEAREAHEELARLYAGLSGAAADRPKRSIERRANPARSPARRRSRRNWQDALLDEALKATFPASDPVSVAFIR